MLLLLISPVDLIPDIIPGIGFADDIGYVFIAIGSWLVYYYGNKATEWATGNLITILIITVIIVVLFRNKNNRR